MVPSVEDGESGTLDEDVVKLVGRTEIRDIRLQHFSGAVDRTPPDEITISLERKTPKYSIEDGRILALFAHEVEYAALEDDDSEPTPVGRLSVTHLVELSLEGEEPSAECVSLLLSANVLFMVYPYVRAALHRLPTEFGLPPVFLPYLRRRASGVIDPVEPS